MRKTMNINRLWYKLDTERLTLALSCYHFLPLLVANPPRLIYFAGNEVIHTFLTTWQVYNAAEEWMDEWISPFDSMINQTIY